MVVRAAGTVGDEMVQLRVDGNAVANFRMSRTLRNFTYRHAGPALDPSLVQVEFLNPGATTSGTTRKARIDRVAVNGQIYQTESPQVYSTGTWTSATGCAPGYRHSEYLQCGGYFRYGTGTGRPNSGGGTRDNVHFAEGPVEPLAGLTVLVSSNDQDLPPDRVPVVPWTGSAASRSTSRDAAPAYPSPLPYDNLNGWIQDLVGPPVTAALPRHRSRLAGVEHSSSLRGLIPWRVDRVWKDWTQD